MTAALPPQPLYLVICGTSIDPWVSNDKVHRMTWDRTVDDIVSLDHFDVSKIIEIGTGRDVTREMVTQAADRWAIQGDPLSLAQFDLIEMHLGTRIARQFEREDA